MEDLRGQDVIDSRDIIERTEELEQELEGLTSSEDAETANLQKEWEELEALQSLTNDADGSPDWSYGETLINEMYFTDYIEELIKDCYEMPKDMDTNTWPFCYMSMDYDAAADAAKVDYMEVDFAGGTYYIRA